MRDVNDPAAGVNRESAVMAICMHAISRLIPDGVVIAMVVLDVRATDGMGPSVACGGAQMNTDAANTARLLRLAADGIENPEAEKWVENIETGEPAGGQN